MGRTTSIAMNKAQRVAVPWTVVADSSLAGGFHRSVLIGPEAQQGRDSSDLIELLVAGDVHNIDSIANRMSHDGVADVFQLGVLFSANRAPRRIMQVHVTAVIALHSRCLEVRSQQKGLHLARLQRTQNPSQTDRTAAIAMGFPDYLADQFLF
jgi:hypothetical protein